WYYGAFLCVRESTPFASLGLDTVCRHSGRCTGLRFIIISEFIDERSTFHSGFLYTLIRSFTLQLRLSAEELRRKGLGRDLGRRYLNGIIRPKYDFQSSDRYCDYCWVGTAFAFIVAGVVNIIFSMQLKKIRDHMNP